MRESLEIRKLFISLKEKEADFGSISPKMESVREKYKKEIREIQLKLNKLRNEQKINKK